MSHYDEFYEAEARKEREREAKAERETPLGGRVTEARVLESGAVMVSVLVNYSSVERLNRTLNLLSTYQKFKED